MVFFSKKLSTYSVWFWIFFLITGFFNVVKADMPKKGNLNGIVIMVDFSDKAGQISVGTYNTLMFGTKPNPPTGSFKDYYSEISYGQLNISGQVNDGVTNWYRLPQPYSYYLGTCSGANGYNCPYPNNVQKMVEDAVSLVAPLINFGPFDNDNDGFVDAVTVVHSGCGGEWAPCGSGHIWSVQWTTSTAISTSSVNSLGNPIQVSSFVTVPEFLSSPEDMTIGVIAHEFGHLLGLPDLYGSSSYGLGQFSLMANGSWNGPLYNGYTNGSSPAHPDAWSKKKLGWVYPSLPASGKISVPMVETNKSIIMSCPSTSGQEYFLTENRQQVGFDQFLPSSGLAIYHVDEAIANNNNPWYPGCTTCTSHYKVAIEQADNYWDLEKNLNSGDQMDLYPGTLKNTTFNASSKPNSNNYAGQATGFSITNIGSSSVNMNVTLGVAPNKGIFNLVNFTGYFVQSTVSVFDGTNYFVAWTDDHTGHYNIYGARVTPCGTVLDSPGINLSSSSYDEYLSGIAFDGANYLIVWQMPSNGVNYGVYGLLVNQSGQIQPPGEFPISANPNFQQLGPVVAFDGTNYLVVWKDTRYNPNEGVIMGARIAKSGSVLDPNGFLISQILPNEDQHHPAIAFGKDRYFVSWEDWSGSPPIGIIGATVSTSGQGSTPITVSGNSYSQELSSVAYNPVNNQFLTIWQDYRNWSTNGWDIYGQLLNGDGSLNGSNFGISVRTKDQSNPSVSFVNNKYYAVWLDSRNKTTDVYGTGISPTGSVLSSAGTSIISTTKSEGTPFISCSGFNCLVTSSYSYPSSYGAEAYIFSP